MDTEEITRLVYISLKRVFESVDHSILCQKSEHNDIKQVNCLGSNHTLIIGGNVVKFMRQIER